MKSISLEYCRDTMQSRQGNSYKSLCPDCEGHNLYVTEHNNTVHCFNCLASFYIEDEDRKKKQQISVVLPIDNIREFYGNILNYYRESLQPKHKEFLAVRGFDASALEKFNIGYCSNARIPLYANKLAKEAGLAFGAGTPFLSDRIIFPYIALDKITDLRGRCMGEEDPKYKSPYHQARSRGAIYPFNYDAAMQRARETKILIITEGEIKAALADLYGFAAVALPGMTNWRPGCIVDSDIKIVIVFDSSPKEEDQRRVDHAIARLYDRLPPFHVSRLHLLGEQKMDIDTFLLHKNGGPDRFKQLLDDSVAFSTYRQLRKF